MGIFTPKIRRFSVWAFLVIYFSLVISQETDETDINVWDRQSPSVVITLLVRNKAHTLAYFLGYLEELDYPKNRLKLFVRVDHSVDDSAELMKTWLKNVREYYHDVNFEVQIEPEKYPNEMGPFDWTDERLARIMALKEEALTYARRSWADYIFFLDCDVFLTDSHVLQTLISARRVAVAPLLRSTDDDYSSFWTTFDDQGEFTRDNEFDQLYKRQKQGVWPVAVVHLAVLLDLRSRKSDEITFDSSKLVGYDDLQSDLHVLARSLTENGARCYLVNEKYYGLILSPMQRHLTDLEYDAENMRYLALESLYDGPPGLLYSPFVEPRHPPSSKMGFDEIYVINLPRRPDRLARMKMCFKILGVDATVFEAVDGASLTDDVLTSLKIRQIPEYRDPYHKRTITRGEIGCFLSHYEIWRQMLERKYQRILIFEDDLRFVRYFRYMLRAMFDDLDAVKMPWDLIYIGRKRLKTNDDGPNVLDVRYLSQVGYSYWTLAYALNATGARKLFDADPLPKLVPVDEYLPIMFDKHPETTWKKYFDKRNLIAYTSEPLFVYPIRYTGERGYISDTENATIVDVDENPSSTFSSSSSRLPDEL